MFLVLWFRTLVGVTKFSHSQESVSPNPQSIHVCWKSNISDSFILYTSCWNRMNHLAHLNFEKLLLVDIHVSIVKMLVCVFIFNSCLNCGLGVLHMPFICSVYFCNSMHIFISKDHIWHQCLVISVCVVWQLGTKFLNQTHFLVLCFYLSCFNVA
jgi:hypothetical protein